MALDSEPPFGSRNFRIIGMPTQKSVPWPSVRCFGIAFEYGKRKADLAGACARLRDGRRDDGHFDAVFVPDTFTLWDADDSDATGPEPKVTGTLDQPLATFRNRLFDALLTFPRPTPSSTMDLRPYLGGYVPERTGPVAILAD